MKNLLLNGFFGWKNIRFGIKELIKMYSGTESFFSHKRFQTGVAFAVYQKGALYVLFTYVKTVDQFVIWAIPELLICGYTLNATQKEKQQDKIQP